MSTLVNKISIILISILLLTITDAVSQDLDYAQYYNNPTYYNPVGEALS